MTDTSPVVLAIVGSTTFAKDPQASEIAKRHIANAMLFPTTGDHDRRSV